MKTKHLLLTILLFLIAITVTAQQGINYKAIINDVDGNILANTPVTVQFKIGVEINMLGDPIFRHYYSEIHRDTSTDANGIIILTIGRGEVLMGEFHTLDWQQGYSLKTEIDIGDGFIDMGVTHFKAVPYALYAYDVRNKDDADADSTNELQSLSISHDTIYLSNGGYVKLPAAPNQDGVLYYRDEDGDGFGNKFNIVWLPLSYNTPSGFVIDSSDCNDENANINPLATEIPSDGIDQNCDGNDNIPDPSFDIDNDGDGYTENEGDCDDTNDQIYPGATEICGDGIDQDCDGNDLNCFGTLTDIDGNTYSTVVLGTQEWMAENLKVTHYPDGTLIPIVSDNGIGEGATIDGDSDDEWAALEDNNTDKAYCFYNNDESLGYGALYTYAAATNGIPYIEGTSTTPVQGVCPAGWHLPSNAEWVVLENYLMLNGYNYDGSVLTNKIAKSIATDYGWLSSSIVGTPGNIDYPDYRNKSGFSALPGGFRSETGVFFSEGSLLYWWSSTEHTPNPRFATSLYIQYNNASTINFNMYKSNGYSIRCIKD